MANILPINLLRTVAETTELDGFEYRAGTLVIPQISVVMSDPINFDHPREFRPERFLDANGSLKRCEHLMPFSLGKRQCLGESLARAELFLIFANIFRHFNLRVPLGQAPPSRQRLLGLTVSPPPFSCWVEKRLND
jgi:cytochrome P450